MKKRWKRIVLIIFFLVGLSAWLYYFPYQKHLAHEATDHYLQAQGVTKNNIKSREIKRDWTLGGYVTMIKYKNDPKLIYEYIYQKNYKKNANYAYSILLIPTKYGSSIEGSQAKYPPLPNNYEEK